MLAMLAIFALFLLTVLAPMGFYYIKREQGHDHKHKNIKRGKLAIAMNVGAFSLVFLLATVLIFTGRIYANQPATEHNDLALAAAFIAAALVTGLGAIGTGIAVSSATAAAIGAVSENENNFGKSMIFVAMAEGIAIYGLLISFMILGRV